MAPGEAMAHQSHSSQISRMALTKLMRVGSTLAAAATRSISQSNQVVGEEDSP